jgi:hypothetical protein
MLNILDVLRILEDDFKALMDEQGNYNLQPLSNEHVVLATNFLLKKFGIDCGDSIHIDHVERIGRDTVENAKTKPQIVQISNGHHWITACLVPGGKAGVTILTMNSFDDSIPCDENQRKHCKEMEEQLQGAIKQIPGYGDVELYKLDVKGQQHGDCCGLATAMNGASLLKTFIKDFEGKLPTAVDGKFDVEAFKKKLSPNVFYQLDNENNLLSFGGYVGSIKAEDFVKRFGSYVLQSFGKDVFHEIEITNPEMEAVFQLKNIFDNESLVKKQQKNDLNFAKTIILKELKGAGLKGIVNELSKAEEFQKDFINDKELQSIVTKYFKITNQSLIYILLSYIFGSQDTKESLEKEFNRVLDAKLKACDKSFSKREEERGNAQGAIQVC